MVSTKLERRASLARNALRVRTNPVRLAQAVALAREAIRRGAMQKPSELAPFLALVARQRPRSVVEIGLGSGGTFWALIQVAHREAVLVSVDLPGGPFGGEFSAKVDEAALRDEAPPGQTIHLVSGDSSRPETVERVRAVTSGHVELLLIDGDHTLEGVGADYENYAPLLCPHALVAFHDILPSSADPSCQVDVFWRLLAGQGPRLEIVSPNEPAPFGTGGSWGGIGVLEARR